MANLSHYGTPAQDAAMNAIGPLLNSGYIDVYTGSMPATPQTAVSGTLLVTLTFSATAFGSSSSGTITANAITGGTPVANGTAGYARLYKSDHTTAVVDCNIGVSGACITFNSTSFTTTGTASVSSLTLTAAMIGA